MIVTVTMNPALDKAVEVDALTRGGLNRIRRVELDAGGKGINVSKTVRALGGQSVATGFFAGASGAAMEQMLQAEGVACDFVYVSGENRTNTKVLEADGSVTELNEPGPEISAEAVGTLLEKLDGYAKEGTIFVLSGSVPAGVDRGIYAQIIRRAHRCGAKVLLDADGELFCRAAAETPDMIKPNRDELKRYLQRDAELSEETLCAAADAFAAQGIGKILISLDGDGALFRLGSFAARCRALPVRIRSTVGAGDAMAAALALACERGLSDEETVRLCMAASAGAVMTAGTRPPEPAAVERLKEQVVMEYLEPRR